MRSLDIVFKEEYERQKELIKDYERQLQGLPRGSISVKTISRKRYAYLKRWEQGKTKTEYIGLADCEAVETVRERLEKAKALELKIKKAQNLIKKMEKGYRATD